MIKLYRENLTGPIRNLSPTCRRAPSKILIVFSNESWVGICEFWNTHHSKKLLLGKLQKIELNFK